MLARTKLTSYVRFRVLSLRFPFILFSFSHFLTSTKRIFSLFTIPSVLKSSDISNTFEIWNPQVLLNHIFPINLWASLAIDRPWSQILMPGPNPTQMMSSPPDPTRPKQSRGHPENPNFFKKEVIDPISFEKVNYFHPPYLKDIVFKMKSNLRRHRQS